MKPIMFFAQNRGNFIGASIEIEKEVPLGTSASFALKALPLSYIIQTSLGVRRVQIEWDMSGYSSSATEAQTVSGAFVNLPNDLSNPHNHDATCIITRPSGLATTFQFYFEYGEEAEDPYGEADVEDLREARLYVLGPIEEDFEDPPDTPDNIMVYEGTLINNKHVRFDTVLQPGVYKFQLFIEWGEDPQGDIPPEGGWFSWISTDFIDTYFPNTNYCGTQTPTCVPINKIVRTENPPNTYIFKVFDYEPGAGGGGGTIGEVYEIDIYETQGTLRLCYRTWMRFAGGQHVILTCSFCGNYVLYTIYEVGPPGKIDHEPNCPCRHHGW